MYEQTARRLFVALCFIALVSACVTGSADEPVVSVDRDWDALLTRTEGWTGGDVAGTVDLHDGRVLWVFGDTWIGRVENGKHASGSKLVNNTGAIHRFDDASPSEVPKELQFLIGKPSDKEPVTAWIAEPTEPTKPPDGSSATWFWTTGGGITIVRDERPTLYVFLFRVQKGSGKDGVWNFRIVGTTMAVFDDIRQPVNEWRPRLVDIPFSFDRPSDHDRSQARWVAWGLALLGVSSADTRDVLIYGVKRQSSRRNDLILAKVGADDLERFDRWKFFVKPDQWSDQSEDAGAVLEDIPTELSVERLRDQSRYVMVHSEPRLGTGIFLRTADNPLGPWSKPHLIHRVKDVDADRRYFTYAAKGHALLSGPGELLVTYVVNSHDFTSMVNDAYIYRPRFFRVKLSP